ncbi:MAG: HAMP domain-containing histidine kinase [Candidatus Melainabacteria bacterium]|nr:HAMP domain-containing histidine kinase [Candidatus Melainabacteria bacterium]
MQFRYYHLKISQKVLLLIAVPLIFELIFVGVLVYSIKRLETAYGRSEQVRAASMFFNIELENLIEAMSAMVLFNVLHETKYLQQFQVSVKTLQMQDQHLKALASSEMAADVNALKAVSDETIASIGDIEKLARTDDRMDMLRGFMKVKRLMSKSSKMGSDFIARQSITSQKLQSGQKEALQLVLIVIVLGVCVSIVISIVLVARFNSGAARQLQAIQHNMQLLSAQKPLNEPLPGGDELALIDQTLYRMAADLDALKSEQQQVYAMITHDLRSPLASITILLDLLNSGALGDLNAKGKDRVKSANAIVSRMVALTNDLLDVEKFESGNFDLDYADVPMQELFAETRAIVAPRAEAKMVEIKIVDTDAIAYCDRERIGRVLVNLTDNAVKFSPKYTTITLAAHHDGAQLRITVQDQGPGIPEDKRKLIFERFGQVSRSDETTLKGSGLGLTISKAIVDAHEGDIGVQSQVGQGSTFWFTLPN